MQLPLDNYYGISKILASVSWVKWVSRYITVLHILKKIMGNIERLRQCNCQGPPQYKNATILEFPLYIKTRLLPFILFSNFASRIWLALTCDHDQTSISLFSRLRPWSHGQYRDPPHHSTFKRIMKLIWPHIWRRCFSNASLPFNETHGKLKRLYLCWRI